MRLSHACSLIVACSILLMACGLPSPEPAADSGPNAPGQSILTLQPTAMPEPTQPVSQPTQPAASKGTITFAFDAFATYYPGIIIDTKGLLKKRGYDLALVPFGFAGMNDVTEDQRWARLKSGEYDIMASTLDGFSRAAKPDVGVITGLIDESAGADKIVGRPEIGSINDLKGKKIAFSQGSVSEYFLYYALKLAGMTPQDVTLLPQETTDDAVKVYVEGQADALSAWEPNVLDAEANGARLIIASDQLRAILDVLVSSPVARKDKPQALQAFHDAWFEALKMITDNPSGAEQAIIDWGHSDWTYIEKPGDLAASLEHLAQASLGVNQIAFQSPDLLISRVGLAQAVWAQAGQEPPTIDLSAVVESSFVLNSARQPQLASTKPPVNSSFVLTARVVLPQLTDQQLQSAQPIAKLPLEQINFEPESARLTVQSSQDIINQVLPALRSSRLYLKIEGSAAWPGPVGRFTKNDIDQVARERAQSLAQFLSSQGVDPNRLLIGTIDSKFPNSVNEDELAQDRIVRFTLISVGGR
ncbi:MAG TPA: ABC transporter substrate-binding protein [Roseiflexaceae bacterium]|nr:ABC transporter substrate-binding protein [Roseiflexaceae bacterium]